MQYSETQYSVVQYSVMQYTVTQYSVTHLSSLSTQGTTMNSTEATETFFATTKLFQSKDIFLRRLVYLAIKEMSKIADDVIIVTSRWRGGGREGGRGGGRRNGNR